MSGYETVEILKYFFVESKANIQGFKKKHLLVGHKNANWLTDSRVSQPYKIKYVNKYVHDWLASQWIKRYRYDL